MIFLFKLAQKSKQTQTKLYFILLVLRGVPLAEISCMLQTNTECNPSKLLLSGVFVLYLQVVVTMQELSVLE